MIYRSPPRHSTECCTAHRALAATIVIYVGMVQWLLPLLCTHCSAVLAVHYDRIILYSL